MGPSTLQPGLGPGLAWLGLDAGWCSCCYLDQTSIKRFMSLSLQMRHLSAILPDLRSVYRQQMNLSHTQPDSGAVRGTSRFRPRTAQYKHCVPRSA